jgi:8-oxo-dGTP pyrophosphatase MutT (NUDIX family)
MRIRVAGVISDGARLLLVQHRGGPHWVLPGGGLEEGESLHACLKREILEETGLLIRPGRLLCVGDFMRPGAQVLDLVFTVELEGGEERMEQNSQITTLRWFSFEEAATLDLRPAAVFRRILPGLKPSEPGQSVYVGQYGVGPAREGG